MKFEFDPVADAAYFEISTGYIEPEIIVDCDGGHVGIQVLSISKRGTQAIVDLAA